VTRVQQQPAKNPSASHQESFALSLRPVRVRVAHSRPRTWGVSGDLSRSLHAENPNALGYSQRRRPCPRPQPSFPSKSTCEPSTAPTATTSRHAHRPRHPHRHHRRRHLRRTRSPRSSRVPPRNRVNRHPTRAATYFAACVCPSPRYGPSQAVHRRQTSRARIGSAGECPCTG
jgi:hypothetical protein